MTALFSKFFIAMLLAITVLLALVPSVKTYAQCDSNTTAGAIQCGANKASQESTNSNQAEGKINSTITKIINLLSVVIGVIAVFVLIIGGLRYITSGGSEQGTKSARETIIYALIGLAVVALAQILVKFVLQHV